MRILVTGAGGFIGSRLVTDLSANCHNVTGAWRQDRARLPSTYPDNLTCAQLDLADGLAVKRLFDAQGFDAVLHCAAQVRGVDEVGKIASFVTNNVLAQANLLDAALSTGCHRFIFCSTISVYGNIGAPEGGYRECDAAPNSFYGWSKRAGEEMLDAATSSNSNLQAVSFRLAGVHGHGRTSGALHAMTRAALEGKTINVAEPDSRFRWLFIDDLVRVLSAVLDMPSPGGHEIVNLASADVFTLGELAERIETAAGSGSAIELGTASSQRNEVMNIERAQALFGYEPLSLDVALQNYIDTARRTA